MVVFCFPDESKYRGRVIYYFRDAFDLCYVGYASDFRKRVSNHRSKSRARKDGKFLFDSVWHEAIRRIGWENLRVKILEYVPEDVSLKERECWWIKMMRSDDPKYGYNSNLGGGGPTKHTAEAKAKMMGNGAKPVTSREIKDEYSDGTQLVEFVCYAGASEAERQTKINHAHISDCCLKKRDSAGNRFWNYTKEDDLVGEHIVDRIGDKPGCNKPLFSVSPAGEKQRHESGRAAGRTLSKSTGKKFSPGHISECCRGEATHHHGYKFYWATPELIAEFHKEQAAPAPKKRKMF
tara:strand:+ start:3646 stop:4524 length:879 start_codon:yes stop_codon:yes gene_type:complete